MSIHPFRRVAAGPLAAGDPRRAGPELARVATSRPGPRGPEAPDEGGGAGPGRLAPAAILALGTFAIGAEGFMIAPLLPTMAEDFGLSVPATASLVVAFTLALALSSPLSTALTGALNRRTVLLLAMGVFTAANLAAALGPGFWGLMGARIAMAVCAGLYVPAANALAGALAGPARRGRALGIVSGGMTLAIALGLPLGAAVGHAFGWRATFLGVAVLGAAAFGGIFAGIRAEGGRGLPAAGLAERLGVARQAPVRRLLAITLMWSIGAYETYPYIAAWLSRALGFEAAAIGWTVSMWGAFAAAGVLCGGALNDRHGSNRVARASLAALAVAYLALAAAAETPQPQATPLALGAIALWGFAVWSFFPAQMARLVAAGPAGQAPVALALNTSTMYFGFSLGSALGAAALGAQALWAIGLIAAAAELAALALDARLVRSRQ
ncbi:MFS transporter [uncultured Albimonas sp.]|uniref:MFS transporter n=1 Tax=uncultured Albimonas sp. TaxID=1331701 RepID=UPI0030ED493E|tara:strand:+ start:214 stop:1530 length:1317 start_codon:yes stop_codon:yes gene_type:complete